MDLLQRLSPALVDNLLALIGFQGQRTTEVKTEQDANNLYGTTPEYDRVEGDFGNLTVPSVTDWVDRNPLLSWGLAASTN